MMLQNNKNFFEMSKPVSKATKLPKSNPKQIRVVNQTVA